MPTTNKRSLLKFKLSMTLLAVMLTLSGCASTPKGTDVHDRCFTDEWQTFSKNDTKQTQDEITRHNAAYLASGCKR